MNAQSIARMMNLLSERISKLENEKGHHESLISNAPESFEKHLIQIEIGLLNSQINYLEEQYACYKNQ